LLRRYADSLGEWDTFGVIALSRGRLSSTPRFGAASGIGPFGVMGSEYTLVEKVNVLRGLLDTFGTLYPQLQGIHFRRSAEQLKVPVYILQGRHELTARSTLALQWFNNLHAPRKRLYTFTDSGHSTAFEEFQPVQRIVTGTVLPQTFQASH
jgi:proline iminopeptidase